MNEEQPFSCKYCHNPEKHDRRGCHARAQYADPVWFAAMRKRNSDFLKAKWAKVKQVEKEEHK
mgnify:CR=1 FL=1